MKSRGTFWKIFLKTLFSCSWRAHEAENRAENVIVRVAEILWLFSHAKVRVSMAEWDPEAWDRSTGVDAMENPVPLASSCLPLVSTELLPLIRDCLSFLLLL